MFDEWSPSTNFRKNGCVPLADKPFEKKAKKRIDQQRRMSTFRFGKKHWKEFTQDDMNVISEEREKHKESIKGANFSVGKWAKTCPACTKPNAPTQNFCTGCS